jgi:quercetin dioxygenase-like cupin family protein
MSKIIAAVDLPRLSSTRDTRDRIDLFTEELFGGEYLKADRILYHPGDTAAAHYHKDCKHVFFVLAGSGLLHLDGSPTRVAAGDVILVEENEVHAFENDTDEAFEFIELWVPAPADTVWIEPDDI